MAVVSTPRQTRAGLATVLAAFAVVRTAVWCSGGRFSTSLLDLQPQLIDPAVLRAHPLRAALNLHIQPPLYNLVVGVVLRWSPWPMGISFQVLWVACGAATTAALYGFLTEVGCGWRLAAVATVIGAVGNPYLLTFEHTLTYEAPTTALITITAWGAARFARTGSLRSYAAFAAPAVALVLTRSLFHPLWLVGALVGVLVLRRPEAGWQRPAAVAAAGLVLVAGAVALNHSRSGMWGLSSFVGMNLQRSTVSPLQPATVQRLIREHTLTQEAQVSPFANYDRYQPEFGPCRSDSHDPELRSPAKRSGFANLNADCYLPVYRAAQHNALAAVRAEPGRYLETRLTANLVFLNEQDGIGGQSTVTDGLRWVYDRALLVVHHDLDMRTWQASPGNLEHLDLKVSITAACSLLVVLALTMRATARTLRRRATSADLGLLYVGGTILFVLIVGTTTELGENGRFRLVLDPLLLGLLVATAARSAQRLPARRLRSRGVHHDPIHQEGPGSG